MSALPLAVPGSSEVGGGFQRHRYNSLPARFKSDDRGPYARWLPAPPSGRSESPEEGGFLEFNNNTKTTPSVNQNGRSSSSSSDGDAGFHSGPLSGATNASSPTPSLSSCSLDMSFTSSVADSVGPTLGAGIGWSTNHSRPSSRASLDSPATYSQRHLLVRRNSDVTAAFNRSVTPDMSRGLHVAQQHRQVAAPVLSPIGNI